MAIWDDILTERDRQVFAAAGYGQRGGFGQKPALLIIDVNYNFVGDRPEPILQSIQRFHNSCGEEGWQAVAAIQRVLPVAREKNVPILYSTGKPRDRGILAGRWATKNARAGEPGEAAANEIVREIAPRPQDIVIEKDKPSCFFGTSLLSYLVYFNVDSLIVCGTTTSGCVRATVVDAFSLNFRVAVIEEATFDRGQASHKVNLFDMNAKYADVVPVAEVLEYLAGLPVRDDDAVRVPRAPA